MNRSLVQASDDFRAAAGRLCDAGNELVRTGQSLEGYSTEVAEEVVRLGRHVHVAADSLTATAEELLGAAV